MDTLPPFTEEGVLSPSDYSLTLEELAVSMLVVGPGDPLHYPNWDSAWRRKLVGNLGVLVGQLWQVGITEIFIDGSFLEAKEHPNDIDGYFACDVRLCVSGDLERMLNELDPHHAWNCDPNSRRRYRGYPKAQLPMWHAYRVELYPHYGQPSGISAPYGNVLTFPEAFRLRREDDHPKGIVKIRRP
jgi:hypothetical protein